MLAPPPPPPPSDNLLTAEKRDASSWQDVQGSPSGMKKQSLLGSPLTPTQKDGWIFGGRGSPQSPASAQLFGGRGSPQSPANPFSMSASQLWDQQLREAQQRREQLRLGQHLFASIGKGGLPAAPARPWTSGGVGGSGVSSSLSPSRSFDCLAREKPKKPPFDFRLSGSGAFSSDAPPRDLQPPPPPMRKQPEGLKGKSASLTLLPLRQ